MRMIHEVWAEPPGGGPRKVLEEYELDEWQYAEKLAEYLRDRGYERVEVLYGEDEP